MNQQIAAEREIILSAVLFSPISKAIPPGRCLTNPGIASVIPLNEQKKRLYNALEFTKGMWKFETGCTIYGRGFDCSGDFCGYGTLHPCCDAGCPDADTDRGDQRQYLRINNCPGDRQGFLQPISGEFVCKKAEMTDNLQNNSCKFVKCIV